MSDKKEESFETSGIPTINEEEAHSLGEIKINHSVVASIVRLAATEVDGVTSVGSSFVDGIAEIFTKKETERGVRVTENAMGNYEIEIRVILSFGVELAKVAVEVQERVRSMVSKMTMKTVSRVNVIIDGVKNNTTHSEEIPEYEKDVR